ncbi:hypothetical protein D3C87_1069000 [compost metagenome]
MGRSPSWTDMRAVIAGNWSIGSTAGPVQRGSPLVPGAVPAGSARSAWAKLSRKVNTSPGCSARAVAEVLPGDRTIA